jgi:dolichol-phosphate mannosyltransferase
MSRFTVLIPVHNEADNIAPLHAELTRELSGHDYTVVVVNDGSTDATASELARHAPGWTVLSTARVGKSRALKLGLREVTTARVVMMDGDLQDDTTAIPSLLADLDAGEGADCAVGCRARRRDGWLIKRFPSLVLNLWISLLFGFRFYDINTGLKAFRTDALRGLDWFENCHRFLPLLVFRAGGRVVQRPVHHRPRHAGCAKFNSPLRFIGGFTQVLILFLGWRSPIPAGVRFTRLLPAFVALLLGGTFFYWAARGWYFANYDAVAFVPHMLRYAQDGELINTYATTARLWDPLGLGRQVGHGFLPSIVTGVLARAPAYQSIHYVIAAQMLLGLLIYARLLARFTTARDARGFAGVALQCLAVVAAGLVLINLEGRPEPFVFLVATIAVWCFISFGPFGRIVIAGFSLSILAVSHPIAALLSGLVFLGYLAADFAGGRSWRAWLAAFVVTLAGLAAWFSLYPYSPLEWVRGHLIHAEGSIGFLPPISPLPWLFSLGHGLRGLLFFVSLGAAFIWLWRHRGRIAHPLALFASVAAFLWASWYFAIRQGFSVYNVDWLTPFGLALLIVLSLRVRGPRLLLATALLLLLCGPVVAFVGEQILRHRRLALGPPVAEVQALIGTARASLPGRGFILSRQFFHFTDTGSGFLHATKGYKGEKTSGSVVLLLSQAEIRRPAPPPAYPGWRLLRHTFDEASGTAASRGLQYALYLSEDVPPPPALDALLIKLQAGASESKASNQ